MAPNMVFMWQTFCLISMCLQDDKTFTTTLNLRLHGNLMVEDELYQVVKTCHYPNWASREIVCDRGYMEASECSKTLGGGHVTVYDKWLYIPSGLLHFDDTAEGRG